MERGDRHHRAGLVLFQGWGEKESDMTAPVPHLPVGPAYSSVRGPYVQGRHYAWFATGRPFAVIREHLVGHTVAPVVSNGACSCARVFGEIFPCLIEQVARDHRDIGAVGENTFVSTR